MSEDETTPKKTPLKVRAVSPPMDVPVFNIVIYVSQQDGKVKAEVVNLPDLVFFANAEPQALKQAITQVKTRLAAWHGASETIPWIDPIRELGEGEQQRLVPVHL